MNRLRLAPMAATLVILLAAWGLWQVLPRLIAMSGLGRYELLLRVLAIFAALGLAEKIAAAVATRFSPGPTGQAKDHLE